MIETTEPIQMSDITAGMQQTFEGMGLPPAGSKKIESIIRAHVNKNAVLNNYSRRTLRFMLWKVAKALYKDMTKNRDDYGRNVSKETVVTVVINTLFLALNRGLEGRERDMFYGNGLKEMFDQYIRSLQQKQG